MKKTLCILTYVATTWYAHGQVAAGGLQSKGIDLPTSNNSFITQLPRAEPEVKGNVYLLEEYSPGKIELNNGTKVEEYSFRYNIDDDLLEILDNKQVRILDGHRVRKFSWKNAGNGVDEQFVSAQAFKLDNVPQIGFLKVIDEGEWLLLCKYSLSVSKGQYVEALDAGLRETRILKKETFFFGHKDKLIAVTPKKDFINNMGGDESALAGFMKDKKLSTKSITDLITIHSFLNRPKS